MAGGVACGRVAAALSWAIMAWIWLLSMPPVLILCSNLLL
jgi:hypothetical protein